MDRNISDWLIGCTYCFHDQLTAAKIGIKAKEAGFEIEYCYNEFDDPSFKVTGWHDPSRNIYMEVL